MFFFFSLKVLAFKVFVAGLSGAGCGGPAMSDTITVMINRMRGAPFSTIPRY